MAAIANAKADGPRCFNVAQAIAKITHIARKGRRAFGELLKGNPQISAQIKPTLIRKATTRFEIFKAWRLGQRLRRCGGHTNRETKRHKGFKRAHLNPATDCEAAQ